MKVFVVYDNTYEFIYGVFSSLEKATAAFKLADSDSAVIFTMYIDVFEDFVKAGKTKL